MPINFANRADDQRRSKYKTQQRQIMSALEQLTSEINSRPVPEFEINQLLKTPNGFIQVVHRSYSNTRGWLYRGWKERRFTKFYEEKQLAPIIFSEGQWLTLPSGTQLPVHRIILSKLGTIMIGLQVSPKRFTWYSYQTLQEYNLPTPKQVIEHLWRAFVKEQGSQEFAKELCLQVVPNLNH